MYRQLIINVNEFETRVALLEDGTIVELLIEQENSTDITGNVVKGRVQRVLPGIQAAFVDIGVNQAAFLYVDDVIRNYEPDFDSLMMNSETGTESFGLPGFNHDGGKGHIPIEDLIVEGQEILVQVVKSPIGTKGARLSTYISLPGRFLVLMPFSTHIGVSKKIENENERTRLKEIVERLRTRAFGYIARTAADGIQEEKLVYEMGFLNNLWDDIQKKYQKASASYRLHQELNVSLRAVRDLFIHEADKLIIDSKGAYETILDFLDTSMPVLKDSVEYYQGEEPLFDAYNLNGDISRALKKKVWLKSGGYIVIERTEALVAIDVNTGRFVGKHNLEETILKTNLEAVREIAYQVRLRDLGGIIIIDFIDMEKKSNQEKVYNSLKDALRKDRSRTHVLPISDLGLVQMTRKRVRKSLSSMLCEPCISCEGEGVVPSRKSICYDIYREILNEQAEIEGPSVSLKVNPEIAELLLGEESNLIGAMERKIGKHVVIYPCSEFHLEQYEIVEERSG